MGVELDIGESMGAAVSVKGIREGVLITLEAGDLPELLTELEGLVDSRKDFFRGGKVALEVGDLELAVEDVGRVCQIFAEREVAVWAIISTQPATRAATRESGLDTAFPSPTPEYSPIDDPIPELASGRGVLVRRTLRSGQTVEYVGHIVVLGDVNPGAEVIAGGDVIVWGHLRGIVHAGAIGNPGCSVCALDLSPTQLRIGNHIARPPDSGRKSRVVNPERAFVSDGQIVAERWK